MAGAFSTEVPVSERDNDMTGLNESRMPSEAAQAPAAAALS